MHMYLGWNNRNTEFTIQYFYSIKKNIDCPSKIVMANIEIMIILIFLIIYDISMT